MENYGSYEEESKEYRIKIKYFMKHQSTHTHTHAHALGPDWRRELLESHGGEAYVHSEKACL